MQGSIEPIVNSLDKLSTDKLKVKILHQGTGNITESDVMLAIASHAIIVGFSVTADTGAQRLAEAEGVDIRIYNIIYNIIEDVQKALTGLLEPVYKEVVTGHAEIRAVFKVSKVGKIAGCMVLDGEITRNSSVAREARRRGARRRQDRRTEAVPGRRDRGEDGLRVRDQPAQLPRLRSRRHPGDLQEGTGTLMTSRRQERIAEVLTEELGLLIASELTDPRLEDALVTVTDVQVSPDLGNARVYIQHALPPAQITARVERTAALDHVPAPCAGREPAPARRARAALRRSTRRRSAASRIDEILDRIARRATHTAGRWTDGATDGQTTTRARRIMPTPTSAALSDLVAPILGAKNILAFCHVNPDGDAIGSLLGLGHVLDSPAAGSDRLPGQALRRRVTLACQDPAPELLHFLPGARPQDGRIVNVLPPDLAAGSRHLARRERPGPARQDLRRPGVHARRPSW